MATLVRFEVSPGQDVLVETDSANEGLVPVARGHDGIVQAACRFSEHLDNIRDAVTEALATFEERLHPDEIRVCFGIRLTCEAGAVIAKTSLEGNLAMELAWHRSRKPE
jgi:hypothetical protein